MADSATLKANFVALGLSVQEVNTWLISNDSDSGTAILSKQEIIDYVNGPDVQESEPELIQMKPKSITSTSAIACIDNLLDYAKVHNFSLDLAVLGNFKEQLGVKALNERKKSTLSSFFKPLSTSKATESIIISNNSNGKSSIVVQKNL